MPQWRTILKDKPQLFSWPKHCWKGDQKATKHCLQELEHSWQSRLLFILIVCFGLFSSWETDSYYVNLKMRIDFDLTKSKKQNEVCLLDFFFFFFSFILPFLPLQSRMWIVINLQFLISSLDVFNLNSPKIIKRVIREYLFLLGIYNFKEQSICLKA